MSTVDRESEVLFLQQYEQPSYIDIDVDISDGNQEPQIDIWM